jgi:hypothetical protein
VVESDLQRNGEFRLAGAAGDQSQDRQNARPHHIARSALPRRRAAVKNTPGYAKRYLKAQRR